MEVRVKVDILEVVVIQELLDSLAIRGRMAQGQEVGEDYSC